MHLFSVSHSESHSETLKNTNHQSIITPRRDKTWYYRPFRLLEEPPVTGFRFTGEEPPDGFLDRCVDGSRSLRTSRSGSGSGESSITMTSSRLRPRLPTTGAPPALPELGTLVTPYSSLVLSLFSLAVSSLVSPALRRLLESRGPVLGPYTWCAVPVGGPETLRRPAGARGSAVMYRKGSADG